MRSGKAPDLDVARFNVGILNLEPICVLVLCTDQTPKNSVHSASCRSDTGIRCTEADQGNLPEALKSFRDGLAIRERLAQADPGTAGWQRDLSVSYERVGDVLVAQGNLPEALKSFRADLAIAERLAQSDPGNAGWQFDLVVSHWKLAANGDDAARRFAFIVAALRKLKAENRLTPAQERLLPQAEAELAKTR